MGGSLNSVGKDPAALTAGRCRLASGVAAPSRLLSPRPAGFSRFVCFLTPCGVASRCFRHSRWLVVNLLSIRACGMLALLHWFLWFLGFPRGRPACPNVFGSYPRRPSTMPMATPTREMPAIQKNAHLVPPSRTAAAIDMTHAATPMKADIAASSLIFATRTGRLACSRAPSLRNRPSQEAAD